LFYATDGKIVSVV